MFLMILLKWHSKHQILMEDELFMKGITNEKKIEYIGPVFFLYNFL
jgi:hypothetical protein